MISPRGCLCELGLVDEVVKEVSYSDLLEPCNSGDVHVKLEIRFLS